MMSDLHFKHGLWLYAIGDMSDYARIKVELRISSQLYFLPVVVRSAFLALIYSSDWDSPKATTIGDSLVSRLLELGFVLLPRTAINRRGPRFCAVSHLPSH